LCEAASTKEISGGSISGQVLTLVYSFPFRELWQHDYNLFPLEAQSPRQVQALICISETQERFGAYKSGDPAYQTIWEARVVRWPSGEVVIASPEFTGDRPPEFKQVGYPAEHRPPEGELIRWLAGVFSDQFIIVHEPYFNISHIAFSPDSETLVTVSGQDHHQVYSAAGRPYQNTIKVWNITSGSLEYTITLQDYYGVVHALTITPDGHSLIALYEGGNIAQISSWTLATGQINKPLEISLNERDNVPYNHIYKAVFSPDTSLVAIGHDKYISIYSTATGALISSGQHTHDVQDLAFSPDGALLASSDGYTLIVWQAVSGNLQYTLHGRGMIFSPDGKELMFVSPNSETDWHGIVFVDALTGNVMRTLGIEEYRYAEIISMAYSPDGKTLAVSSSLNLSASHDLTIWNTQENEIINVLNIPWGGQLVYSPDGECLAIKFLAPADMTDIIKLYPSIDLMTTIKK
jgi:hypothetical protein